MEASSSWYPGWKEEYEEGPAFQLSNTWVSCARPQAEARLPQVGSGALPSPSVRSASYRDGWGPHFGRKGLGPEREVMRHLIRGGGGLLLCGSGGQGGAGRGRVAAQALDTFTTLPSRGCHTLPGHKGPQDLHIRYTKSTPGWTLS